VVRAERVPPGAPREDRAAAASVVRPDDSPRAYDDLGTLLVEVPGVNVTRLGGLGSFTTLSLRGSNPDQVRIYVDGIPLNQALGGAVDLSTLPLGDVERVEVYRGSTPIAFGESALGGVVSITTRTPGETRAAARAGGGSFRTTFADAVGGGQLGRLRLYAGVHALRAVGDFPSEEPPRLREVVSQYWFARRENNDLIQLDGVARAALPLGGRCELRAGLIGFWRDRAMPAMPMIRADAARGQTARLLGYLDFRSREPFGAGSALRAGLFASVTRDAFSDPEREVLNSPTLTHDVTASAGATALGAKTIGGWARVTGIAEARGERYLPANDLDAQPMGYAADRQVATAGLELDALAARLGLHLVPSARLELSRDVRTGRDPQRGIHLPPLPPVVRALPVLRLGLIRPLAGGVELRGNLGRYARLPSFYELYGYNRGVLGNPTLRPEQGVNADLGVTARREAPGTSLVAVLTTFGALVDDLITWSTNAYTTRADNTAAARIWGVEAELRLRQGRLAAVAQATLTYALDAGPRAANRGNQIAHHPRYRGYGRLEWRQPFRRGTMAVRGYADLDVTAGVNWTTTRYGGIPARPLAGAGAILDHVSSGLRLAATAANLGDVRSFDVPDYPQPGRSILVSLAWSSPLPPKE
jgi:iron complex outermembrane receptor protein